MSRPLAVFDIECYRDYFLAKFKTIPDGRVRSFELHADSYLDTESIRKIVRNFTLIDFNGNNYDKWMLFHALSGASDRELKMLSDHIIVNPNNDRIYDIARTYGIQIPNTFDHIDLIEIPKGIHGLKLYGARLHCPKLQDLPIPPEASIAPHERPLISNYCGNDLDTTIALYDYLKPQIDLRIAMGDEYKMDLRSKSDAQIAEAVIKHEAEARLGSRIYRPELPAGYKFYYKAPSYVKFEDPRLQDLLVKIQQTPFFLDKGGSPILPKFIEDMVITLGTDKFNLSMGGLHSMESSSSYYAEDGMLIEDIDVTSFYPWMIINNGWFPKHIGPIFIEVLHSILNRRVKAKGTGKKLKKLRHERELTEDELTLLTEASTTDGGLKIVLNSSFGKFGSKWSTLYSPDLMIQTTISGQLSLLMLMEQFTKHGIRAISANTDGIVTYYPSELKDTHRRLVAEWEFATSLNMEFTEYRAYLSRDVNAYMAIKPDGSVKGKGPFASSIDEYGHVNIDKTPTNDICVDAVVAYLIQGIPLETTIRECRDIRKFVSVRNVRGGGEYVIDRMATRVDPLDKEFTLLAHGWTLYCRRKGYPDPANLWLPPNTTGKPNALPMEVAYTHCKQANKRQYLGKVARWVMATGENGHIEYQSTGNRVPKTEGVRPLMDLPEQFPDYLDYDRYIKESQDILKDIGALK